MSQDIFKSVPAKGAIERDWTNKTIILDLQNGIGEKCQLDVILPILGGK